MQLAAKDCNIRVQCVACAACYRLLEMPTVNVYVKCKLSGLFSTMVMHNSVVKQNIYLYSKLSTISHIERIKCPLKRTQLAHHYILLQANVSLYIHDLLMLFHFRLLTLPCPQDTTRTDYCKPLTHLALSAGLVPCKKKEP